MSEIYHRPPRERRSSAASARGPARSRRTSRGGPDPARSLPFLKVEGAGNDFVLVDGRRTGQRPPGKAIIQRILDRRRGAGGDGLLWLSRDTRGTEAWVRYWNADGGRASFCGNGARCVALFLLKGTTGGDGGADPRERPRGERKRYEANGTMAGSAPVVFRLESIEVTARRERGGRIAVLVPEPRLRVPPAGPPRTPRWLTTEKPVWVDSGVPHWVVPVPDVDALDLPAVAAPLRRWRGFGADGTNVDFVSVGRREIRVRTWERGVEGETLACGSGIVAAGWWALFSGATAGPVRLRSWGGDRFVLRKDSRGRGFWLEGPARVVYTGTLDLERAGVSR